MKIADLSHWNTITDWNKLNKDLKLGIFKCTQGVKYVDPTFATNRKKFTGVFGAYHFADGLDAINEASHFISTLGEIKDGTILVLDYEIHLENPDLWCSLFLDYVSLKTRVKPLLYINSSTAKSFDWSRVIKKGYKLWIASYGINNGEMGNPPAIGKFKDYILWQFTSRGKVEGITGYVDLNYTKDFEALKACGKSTVSPKIEVQATPTPEVIPEPQPVDTTPKQDETVPIPVTVTETPAPVADPYPIAEAGIPYEPEKVDNWFIALIKDIINLFIK